MSARQRYSPDFKRRLVKESLNGDTSYTEIAKANGLDHATLHQWILMYKENGPDVFAKSRRQYTKEEKETCVREALEGKASIREIAARHNISDPVVLRSWIKRHITGKEQTDYVPHQEDVMAVKTTFEQRLEIVEYCTNHQMAYKETAELFHVSYAQVYDWVKKYLDKGEEALQDRRGRRKAESELDETERLRRENKRLKIKLEEAERTNLLLKKVQAFERGSVSAR